MLNNFPKFYVVNSIPLIGLVHCIQIMLVDHNINNSLDKWIFFPEKNAKSKMNIWIRSNF